MAINDPADNAASKATLDELQRIMALSEAQRLALLGAWTAIDPIAAGRPESRDGRAEYSGGLQSGSPVEDTLTPWLQGVSLLPKRQRYSFLEDALARADSDSDRSVIAGAMQDMTNHDAVFALEVSATRYAYEHPVMIVLGLLGLGLFVWAAFKGAWRLMF